VGFDNNREAVRAKCMRPAEQLRQATILNIILLSLFLHTIPKIPTKTILGPTWPPGGRFFIKVLFENIRRGKLEFIVTILPEGVGIGYWFLSNKNIRIPD
jgi:hypothetical protein